MIKNILILVLGYFIWLAYFDEAHSANQENQYCDIKTTIVKTVDKDGKTVNEESKEIVESGSFQANINQSQSISSVDILSTPQGIGDCTLFTKNNTNGIPITNITIGSTIVTDTTSGIVTVTLATPVLGFSTAPFSVNEEIFVEGLQKFGATGGILPVPIWLQSIPSMVLHLVQFFIPSGL